MGRERNLPIGIKKKVEEELREYPYKLMSLEISGLGTVVNPAIKIEKHRHPSGSISRGLVNKEINERRLHAIEWVYEEKLTIEQRRIIQACYFEDNTTKPSEIVTELMISESTYRRIKKDALIKFATTLGYL